MQRTLLAAAFAAGLCTGAPAFAAETKTDDNDTSAMPTPVQGVDDVAPLEGANSYTMDQVNTMLAENGFTNVAGLVLDDKGVWRGTATHDAMSGDVAVDYRGNLFFQSKRVTKTDEMKTDEEAPK